MLDKDMREPLFDYLDTEFGKVRTIEEKIIKKSRADVLAITDGAIIGIEIKSDADTYTRLATQVKDYDKYCDYCYIAVGESHRLHAAEHVPDHWGVLVISPDGEVREQREAELNKKVKLKTQLDLLWRPELLGIQLKYGYPKYAAAAYWRKSHSYMSVIMLVKEEAEEEKDADLSDLRSVK